MIARRTNVFAVETDAQQSFAVRVKNDDYRTVVARIVKELEAEKDWDDERLAEELGCSKGTVKNARLKKGNLDPVTMLNLGALFGGQERLKPVLGLINCSPGNEPSIAERITRAQRELDRAIEELAQ